MDELKTLQHMFAAVPDPEPTAIEQARQRVREQAAPSRSLPYRPNHLAVAGVAAACLALVGGGVVAVGGHPAPHSGPASAAGTTVGTTMTLTDYRQAATQALGREDYIVKSTQRMSTPTGIQDVVTWDSGAGADFRWRIQSRDTSGHLLHDMAIRERPAGGDDHIEYIGVVNEYAQWTVEPQPEPGKSVMPGASAPQPPSAQDAIRRSLASGALVLVGPTRLAGKAAILLTYTEGSPGEVGYKQGKLWIDATSYLTLQDTVTMEGNTTTIVYSYLSPTAENKAQLWIVPQSSWKHVSSDQLPRNLVS